MWNWALVPRVLVYYLCLDELRGFCNYVTPKGIANEHSSVINAYQFSLPY